MFALSHGQITVKKEFSINTELLIENMKEMTISAGRFAKSSIKKNVCIFTNFPLHPG